MHAIHPVTDRQIVVDEVGLRLGLFDDTRLRTIHQPVYQVHDGRVALSGVRAYLQPARDGAPLPTQDFLASLPPADRRPLDRMVARLHAENRTNAGIDDPGPLDCWIGVDSGAGVDGAFEQLSECASAASSDADRFVCEIMHSEALSRPDIDLLTTRAHARGLRVCVDALGAPGEALRDVEADFVKMRGSMFRNLARVRKAADLIALLVEGWRKRGVRVLVEGIETRGHLAIAVDAGATHVQGFLLGTPKLAGVLIDDRPRALADILYGEEKACGGAS